MKPNYEKLKEFLENGADIQPLSFKQIEMIIGSELPPVYTTRKTLNQKSSRIRMAAEEAGFYLSEIDYTHSWINFERPTAIVVNGQEMSVRVNGAGVSEYDLGRDLDDSIRSFKSNWSSIGGEYVPFCDKYDNLDDVYFNAGMEAYRAAMKRAIKFNNTPQCVRSDLRIESCRYLAERFRVLFAIIGLDYDSYNDWAEETTKHIRSIYRDNGVEDYTIGNAQKLINVALKFVMSSNIVDYRHDVFKYCHFPVDGIIQGVIKRTFRINPLRTCWSKNDSWEEFLNYQTRVREAVLANGYYSPIVWEATHWN